MKPAEQQRKKQCKRAGAILAGLVFLWLLFGLPDGIRAHQRRSEWLAIASALQKLPPDLNESIAEFRASQAKTGEKLRTEVPLQELVASGHLRPEAITGLTGYQAFVFLSADETSPSSVLVRVAGPDHLQIVLLTDGSILKSRRNQ